MILLSTAILIVVVLGAYAVFRLMSPAPQAALKRNRHSKRRSQQKIRHKEPSLGRNPLQQSMIKEDKMSAHDGDDSDVILGLKAKPVSAPKEQQQLQFEVSVPPQKNITETPEAAAMPALPKAIILHIEAQPEHPFSGYELLQALLASGLRYGKMQIFHRHEEKTGKGAILFSLVNSHKPGTFDLTKMGGFACTSLSLFFSLATVAQPLEAYNLMLETAGQLIEDLGGTVLNAEREPLTQEQVIAMRRQLKAAVAHSQYELASAGA